MEREFKILRWDEFHFGAVLTHWPQENTVAGTVWRFVMDRGQTLVVTPYQTPDKPAPGEHCTPEQIEPILAAGRFGFSVRYAAGVNINLDGRWETEERNGKTWPVLTTWEQLIDEAADAACRKRIEEEKAAREKELIAGALEELRDMLSEYGIKRIAKKKCKMLFDFIRQDVCDGNIMNPAISNAGFERVIAKVAELTGKDITESLLMECKPWRLVHESGAEGVERVRWVAMFPDGRETLIESLGTCIHNGRDVDLFEKVKPSDGERQVIERVIIRERQAEAKKQISEIRAEAGRKNKRTTEQEDKDISNHYWGLRKPKDPNKKPKSKSNAGELTADWIVRAKVNGGYGRSDLEYSSRQVQRKAGDSK